MKLSAFSAVGFRFQFRLGMLFGATYAVAITTAFVLYVAPRWYAVDRMFWLAWYWIWK